MKPETRYTLHAYIGGPGCVRVSQHVGALTFQQIFIERPEGCRYAVATETPPQVVVWDLYSVTLSPTTWVVLVPDPVISVASVDAAIMATAMHQPTT